ncbi:MAG TPA: c-type cytochrome domain-containing protein [Bdellovibrionales bacterium]|nr:c-type cytochrome domain-containing protein [Bdellovibrionales bacterium]
MAAIRGLILGFTILLLVAGCNSSSQLKFADNASEALTVQNAAAFIRAECSSCHREGRAEGRFGSAGDLKRMINEGLIVPGKPDESRLFTVIQMGAMPPSNPFDEHTVLILREWIRDMDPYEGDSIYVYSAVRAQLFAPKCLACHGAGAKTDLSDYQSTMKYVVKRQPEYSLLYEALHEGADDHGVTREQRELIAEWIRRGARE